MTTTTPPLCAGCGSEDLQPQGNDRFRCGKCGWQNRIGPDGIARSALNLSAAGKPRKSFKPQFVRRWPKRK